MPLTEELHEQGHACIRAVSTTAETAALRAALAGQFARRPGVRGLLEHEAVRAAAHSLRVALVEQRALTASACAIQAIAFNKTAATNWKVPWHQDVQFPFRSRVEVPGVEAWSQKAGANYAQPPRHVLESMLAVRLHLDPCGPDNGPLRVIPGSHRDGVLSRAAMDFCCSNTLAQVCVAGEADAILMRPLLLHASSPASRPAQRRVLHFVFADSPLPEGLAWQSTA